MCGREGGRRRKFAFELVPVPTRHVYLSIGTPYATSVRPSSSASVIWPCASSRTHPPRTAIRRITATIHTGIRRIITATIRIHTGTIRTDTIRTATIRTGTLRTPTIRRRRRRRLPRRSPRRRRSRRRRLPPSTLARARCRLP